MLSIVSFTRSFTGQVVRKFTLQTYGKLLIPTNLGFLGRTAWHGAGGNDCRMRSLLSRLVTILRALHHQKQRHILYIAVTLPLWSSYLVRVYAWKLILAKEGIISWFRACFILTGC